MPWILKAFLSNISLIFLHLSCQLFWIQKPMLPRQLSTPGMPLSTAYGCLKKGNLIKSPSCLCLDFGQGWGKNPHPWRAIAVKGLEVEEKLSPVGNTARKKHRMLRHYHRLITTLYKWPQLIDKTLWTPQAPRRMRRDHGSEDLKQFQYHVLNCTIHRKLISPPRADPSFAAHQLAPCLCLNLLKYRDSEQSEIADTKMTSAYGAVHSPESHRNWVFDPGLPQVQVTNSQACTRWTLSLFMISCYIWRKTPPVSEVLAFPQF